MFCSSIPHKREVYTILRSLACIITTLLGGNKSNLSGAGRGFAHIIASSLTSCVRNLNL